jgi:hypothetical protein
MEAPPKATVSEDVQPLRSVRAKAVAAKTKRVRIFECIIPVE